MVGEDAAIAEDALSGAATSQAVDDGREAGALRVVEPTIEAVQHRALDAGVLGVRALEPAIHRDQGRGRGLVAGELVHARERAADGVVRDLHLGHALAELGHDLRDEREQPLLLAREVVEQQLAQLADRAREGGVGRARAVLELVDHRADRAYAPVDVGVIVRELADGITHGRDDTSRAWLERGRRALDVPIVGSMFRAAVILLGLLLAAPALAQEKPAYLLKKDQTNKRTDNGACPCAAPAPPPAPPAPPSPWSFKLRIGSVFQLNQSSSVVGKIDGTTRSFQLDVHGEVNWEAGDHQVRTRLDTIDVIVKTQNTGRWVPASDFLEAESIYQYRRHPQVGPFARVGGKTSVFLGRDLRTNAVRYELPDGMLTSPRTEYRLTDRFLPLTLVQSAGVFYNPVRRKQLDVDLRGGLGVREVFANDQLGLQDDAQTTDVVELVQLRSYSEAGLEAIAMLRGEAWRQRVSYYVGGEFLIPLVRTREPGDDRTPWQLVSKTIRIGLAYRLAKAATLLYELRLVHQPQLIDVVQIQNNVGFKATFNLL